MYAEKHRFPAIFAGLLSICACRNGGNFRLDVGYFDFCVERFPSHPVLYVNRGVARFTSGQVEGAIEDFRKATEIQPDYPEARLSLISALATGGRPKEAMAEAEKAVAMAKDRTHPVYSEILALQRALEKAAPLSEAVR